MRRTGSFILLLALLGSSCAQKEKLRIPASSDPKNTKLETPPETWQEHWFEHKELVKRVYYNDEVAVYYDDDTPRDISWPWRKANDAWKYVKKTYGNFGEDPRLYVVLHTGKLSGGHPASYFDASHDNRNMVDLGSTSWRDSTGWNLDAYIHEIGHIVEGASHGVKGSPAFGIWRDSKWMEIFNYDVYVNLGWKKEAESVYQSCMATKDNFPRPNTTWFKDWFYPIYQNYGQRVVLQRFFTLLAANFPQKDIALGKEYTRGMNYGEFIHFWSGAAKTDLKALALQAFGDKDDRGNSWLSQLEKAKTDFPAIKY
ncbi:hypothetical protein ACL9RF_03365 [Sphingobacterium sp. Mn56C]|uniref:hypothetical protein n=1 Tax=Sphingobacterium sp. Mn56C TaxID=3395261 RepID=UPI003BEDE210